MNLLIKFKSVIDSVNRLRIKIHPITETDNSVFKLLNGGIAFQEIKQYLNIDDISFDAYLRRIIPKNLYLLYPKVSGITLLKLYNEVSIRRHKRLKVLYQSVGYWLFLHFMVLVMLLFYRKLLLPTIASEIEVFSTKPLFSTISSLFSLGLVYLHGAFLLFVLIMSLVLFHRKMRMIVIAGLNTFLKCNLIVLCISEQFCLFYNVLYPETKTTLSTIKCLRTSLSNTLAGSIAFEIERMLEHGKDICDALAHSSLHPIIRRNMREGFLFNELEKSLNLCLNLSDVLILYQLKKVICVYRVFVSINIIMIVVVYYELVMIPLKLMEGL
ncbi:hypothetical protein PT226_04055 [Erysipelothrix rhusiopathiae]|uniref:hypothetical protein n=1 Tax=Erysipelothrix rhusiopathiae TaxID=1648 RepID=UPI0011C07B3A|nr:hypothetical protein [Erysipelothrix rhusiopathiae]UPU39742.1 hypothetical protein MX850_03155 [Erysipelothrix sp. Poltava]MDE8256701.1 hypothetical protein [Erysipelothrix rhusiopathiae]MDE8257782.1 hypothetical protein [Erysipelothrix rhusiopathiae]MDE8339585.1 hypothetical protein [Erysipelothrix rhusiopathiae]MDE9423608.1 hypothetical protein [Erysipelothrix rhusiopathiae]